MHRRSNVLPIVFVIFMMGFPGIIEANGGTAVEELRQYVAEDVQKREPLSEQSFAQQPLTKEEAEEAFEILWEDMKQQIAASRQEALDARVITVDGVSMKFDYKIFGEPVEGKRSLYISMHGGGGTTPEVNDQQWENQKGLYEPEEGIYLAPRAPSNDWNLWHKPHIDPLFDYLISTLVVLENVDPNRVYLMGYSAGGDGVYQLAPRMADRFAAAAMMAGHPNDAEPYGLRNIGFTIHMGGQDKAYNRNTVAKEWGEWLEELQEADPEGYKHWVAIYPTYGHWMNRVDRAAVPWMAKFVRDPYPNRVVWRQDDVTHTRFYWLGIREEDQQARATVIASYEDQTIQIEQSDVKVLKIRLNDEMVDLDQPIKVVFGEKVLFSGKVERTIETMAAALQERQDPASVFYAEIIVEL
ncbi:MAG: alpha/beta hydrolase [Firmicutes bacterium]|nr:alpha/beta hydrolase [Bacillota bacterium]